jgi:hypothetical protein
MIQIPNLTTMQHSMSIIERPSMVLLIDCWAQWDEPSSDTVRQCFYNIKNFCETNPYVHAIGLATYHVDNTLIIGQEEPWYSNARELFYSTTRWEKLRRNWTDTKFDHVSHTHKIVRDLNLRADQTQFLVLDTDQLVYYCNHVYTIIENIYVFGIASDVCLECRPLGWRELTNLNRYNLFTTPKNILSNIECSLDCKKNFITEISSPWKTLYNSTIILDQDQV